MCDGREFTALGKKIGLPDHRRIYHFHLTDLEPDTSYTVQVEDSCYSFKTLAKEPPYCFVEGGDWENTGEAKRLAKVAASYKPDAVLLGGDYPSGVIGRGDYGKWDHWLDVYTMNFGMTPLVMAIGNHEVVGGYDQPKEQAPFFFHYFRTEKNPESFYTIPLGEKIQLYILDTGHVVSHKDQVSWLKEHLQTDRMKIMLYHVPLFPSVRFAQKKVSYRFTTKLMQLVHKRGRVYSPGSNAGQKYWWPLFREHKVALAFEHHDQTLKRTKPIDGTTYLGDGGWGAVKQFPPIQSYFHRYFAKIEGNQHFFWLMEIDSSVKITALDSTKLQVDAVEVPLRAHLLDNSE
ncbi:MAG: hypothetical protein S4CHLAM81_08340 [Chlamydiales bacterium]|nr:hypothetical protein [Chlamydiales bacterium]MCH9635616.1 hypothetical protein [Chlamydiales bacterium]